MDEINKIKKARNVKGQSINEIAKEFNRSWSTVNTLIELSPEQIRLRGKRPGRKNWKITPEVEASVIQLLDEEVIKNVKRKQRYTSSFIFKHLKQKSLYNGSERQIRKIVSKLRVERAQEKNPPKAFLNLEFDPGLYLQLDHGEADVVLGGQRIQGFLFVASVPGMVLRYCQFFLTKSSVAWGEFHHRAFQFFGGIFANCIYDNDSVLMTPSTGKETSFSTELQIHYRFNSIYCNKASGWEKGAVENAVGFSRRNYLAGLPEFQDTIVMNEYLNQKCKEEINSGIHYESGKKLTELFSLVQGRLITPIPAKEWGIWEELSVDSFQLIKYDNKKYSVPERYVGSTLKVFITVEELKIFDGNDLIVIHKRNYLNINDTLVLDHFLDQMARKPRAIKFAKVMHQQVFPDCLIQLRKRLQNRLNENEADREFIKILCLRREFSQEELKLAVDIGLSYGGVTFDAINSIIIQLNSPSPIVNFPQELLPNQCITNLERQYNLSQYSQLIGGSS